MIQREQLRGLTDSQVAQSRAKNGHNTLTPPARESLWSQFAQKFHDPIIRILLVALALSAAVSCYEYASGAKPLSIFLEPIGIFLAVSLATCVGFFFELNANKKFELLNQVNDQIAVKVMRNGTICEIPRSEVVVDDIVILSTGEEVPADGELLEATSLQINESTLTGEPLAKKSTNPQEFSTQATYPTNYAMKGTTVVEGHGILRITAIGDSSEYGKVYEGARIKNDIKTPLNIQLDRLAELITKASYIIASLIIVVRMTLFITHIEGSIDWLHAGSFLLHTLMIAVTVIVVSVPEGLPMSVTLSLALSMKRMLRNNNLVRKMHACETMGAVTVICTDKTGTLTQNQMRVAQTDLPQDQSMVAEAIACNSTAYIEFNEGEKPKVLGNPTEGALLLWLHDQGIDYLPLRQKSPVIEQLTFSTERKYMATVALSSGRRVLYIKGAPEIVMTYCSLSGDGQPMEQAKEQINERLTSFQNQAMRTLAVAYKVLDSEQSPFADGRLAEDGLTLMGIVAISDPLRVDVAQAIGDCAEAGIMVKIVTGDTPSTAKEIGRQIGLWLETDTDTNHMTGVEFAAMSDEQLLERVMSLKIMSRARPMDKERLVRLLQQKGAVVAVTGDGTNDAPALNAAQVGLSMGDGTSVAKEASAITILDNSFNSIAQAVMWGRSLYKNIQRFILFQMTINIAACLIVLIGAFVGAESPLTISQMLWVNLIMDTFAALALASLPPTMEVMRDKPRKTSSHIITKAMARGMVGTGIAFVVVLFAILQYFKSFAITSLTQLSLADFGTSLLNFSSISELTAYELTLFFTIFVMLQFWNMFNAKAFGTGKSAFAGMTKCLEGFVPVALLIVAGQWFIVTFGGAMFNVVPLAGADWIIITIATSAVLWIGEAMRFVRRLTK